MGYHDITATLHCLPHQHDIGDAILAPADQLGAGLIAMGAYGKPAVQEFFFGSTTTRVLKTTTLLLFLYH